MLVLTFLLAHTDSNGHPEIEYVQDITEVYLEMQGQ